MLRDRLDRSNSGTLKGLEFNVAAHALKRNPNGELWEH